MRIVVNDIAASKGGALSVLKDFYNFIKENDRENEWIFLLGDKYLEDTDNIRIITLPEVKKSKLKKLRFDFLGGKKFINNLKPDRVISLQNIITFGVKAPQTVYIHQSIPFQSVKNFSFFKKAERKLAVYQHIIGKIIMSSAKKADHIIVQTEWIKAAIAEKTRVCPQKISVVSPAVVVDTTVIDVTPKQNLFFYPTSSAIYKNNACIEKACEILENRGINDYSVRMTLNQSRHTNIKAIGYISRDSVLREYAQATLVFPSYIESFGYPLAEAEMLDSVILAADCPYAREVLQDYENAYFFDPFAPNKLADLMQQVICGKIQRQSTQQRPVGQEPWKKVLEIVKR